MKRYIVLLYVFVISMMCAQAQVKIEFDAPERVDMSEEYFQIRFTVNSMDVSNFTPPSLDDFVLLGGPYSSVRSSTSIINGKSRHEASTTYTYTLAPKNKGTYKIGPATAEVDGKIFHSPSRTIQVTGEGKPKSSSKGNSSAREPRDSRQRAGAEVTNKDLFITVSANRRKIYEQEPILLTYRFYARPDVMLSQIGILKKPDFKGMLSQDINISNIQMSVEELNGVSYRSGVIQKYVIFPQGTGKITVPGVTFNCDVIQRDVTIDPFEAFFNGGGTISRTLQRKVDDVHLDILPLPQPKPAGFSGGVGHFSIKGEMLTSEFKTNDVVSYRIIVEGVGNLKLITAPQLSLSSDFDVYTPKVTEETSVSENGISGRMIYDYTFVPRKMGDFKLPGIQFTYFDPVAEKYTTISTKTESMHVVKGERTNEEYQRTQNLQRSDIRDIRNANGDQLLSGNLHWWGTFGYWMVYVAVVVLAFLFSGLVARFQSSRSDVVSLRSRKAAKVASKKLKRANAFMKADRRTEFYEEVSNALYGYIRSKYNIDLSGLSKVRIQEEFAARNVNGQSVSAFIKLLDECDFARYAPSSQVMGMQEMYQLALNTIVDIEKQN